jgi:hypothetical protein
MGIVAAYVKEFRCLTVKCTVGSKPASSGFCGRFAVDRRAAHHWGHFASVPRLHIAFPARFEVGARLLPLASGDIRLYEVPIPEAEDHDGNDGT